MISQKLFAVISGSKVKILKVNHNDFGFKFLSAGAVISGSKVKILKVNHNSDLQIRMG